MPGSREGPIAHFRKRAARYERSSRWVGDRLLIGKMCGLAGQGAYVLDLAIGTGKVAAALRGRAGYVVGLDICAEMAARARARCDGLVLGDAQLLPFKAGAFDACLCRQGLQFMDVPRVLAQVYRVLRPGGRLVLCHLAAYGEADREETFRIQRLRNPARKNFFLPGDFVLLLEEAGFGDIGLEGYPTRESVAKWTRNAEVADEARAAIREAYENASGGFLEAHRVRFTGSDIMDTMLMCIVSARKKGGV